MTCTEQFSNPVYVILCKPHNKFDLYSITGILHLLEKATGDRRIGVKVAIGLCIGGNDFLPRYNFFGTHSKVMQAIRMPYFLTNLVVDHPNGNIKLDKEVYVELIKQLYLPKEDVLKKSFEEVRKLSIFGKSGPAKSADKWLPPLSCVEQMATLTSTVIDYLLTAGQHHAPLPDFSQVKCLTVTSSGKVMYDFGPDSHQESVEQWCRSQAGTPKKKTVHGTTKRANKSTSSLSPKRLFEESGSTDSPH